MTELADLSVEQRAAIAVLLTPPAPVPPASPPVTTPTSFGDDVLDRLHRGYEAVAQ